jgi:hypothetical protein
MPPTQVQRQQFEDLREQLAKLIKDLVEEEYRTLPPDRQTRGRQFFEDDVTAEQIWEEMMLQWNPREQWCGDWIVTSIDPRRTQLAGFDLAGAAERGPWLAIFTAWEENLRDFLEFSEEDATSFLATMRHVIEDMENGRVALDWAPETR